jgi:hypothetical protein
MDTRQPEEEDQAGKAVLSHSRPRRIETHLHLAWLYREELVEAARIIRDECGNVEIDFHDDRGTTGTAPEAFARFAATGGPERLQRLTITGRRGTTSLQLLIGPTEARVLVEEPDNAARGAMQQIATVCNSHPMPVGYAVRRFLSALLLGGGAAFLSILFLRGSADNSNDVVSDSIMTAFALLVSFAVGVRIWRLPVSLKTVLVNVPRSQRPTWWERHRKDVLLLLIGGVIGGVIGYFVNQIPPL